MVFFIHQVTNGPGKHIIEMVTDAVEATFDGGVPNFTVSTVKASVERHEKNLDIGNGRNTRTVWHQ